MTSEELAAQAADEQGRLWLRQLYDGGQLSQQQSFEFVRLLMENQLAATISAALLALLSQRGESSNEIAGALLAVAAAMRPLDLRSYCSTARPYYDVVGTGGDGKSSVNFSTATAICLAAMGLACAKHGNGAQSGFIGSADILRLSGVPINLQNEEAGAFFKEHDFLFLFAPNYHPALKHAAPIRRSLKIPTLFNLLGPLSNPTKPYAMAVGVNSIAKLALLSLAAEQAGKEEVFCYAAEDGFDEVSTAAKTQVFKRGKLLLSVEPEQFFKPFPLPVVNSSKQALQLFERMLGGGDVRLSQSLAINVALCLKLFGANASLDDGYRQAYSFINSGAALKKLESMKV